MAAVGDPRGYYRALGVERTASAADIRLAFRRMAKRLHPDANGGDREAEEKLKDVNRAYSLLRQRLGAGHLAAAAAAAGAPP